MNHTVLEPQPLPSPLPPLPRARAPATPSASNPARGQFANGEHRQAAVARIIMASTALAFVSFSLLAWVMGAGIP